MAPMIGVRIVQKAERSGTLSESTPWAASWAAWASAPNTSAPPAMSMPAQKARPAPVTTMTRTASSASSAHIASWNSRSIVWSNAFMASGRLRVSVATPWSSTSTSTVS